VLLRLARFAFLCWTLRPPGPPGPDSVEARKVNTRPLGVELPDAVWLGAAPTVEFVQREPHEGAAPSQRTEFRVAYDASTLYVKVRAFDAEPDKIVTFLTRRDDNSPCDWLRVFIDSYHDRRTAYEFAVNPSGVKQDRYWFNDSDRDDSWDAVWDVSVTRDGDGWLAEFRIPFSQLRFSPAAANTFGLAVVREIGRLKETSTWPLLPRAATGYVSSFGDLTGLAFRLAKKLEVAPYVLSSVETAPVPSDPLEIARSQRQRESISNTRSGRAHAYGDGQSGFRPGRSRSRRRQPRGLRDLLQRAAAVFRRRIRQLRLRPRLQRRRMYGALLLTPDRPRAASLGGRAGERLLGGARV
jgi:hypothetical protein